MKNLKVLALLGLGCCLLACSRQKASESPKSGSSDSSSKASSMSQARSKTAGSSQSSANQSSPSQSSASAESESSSQTSEKVREEETQPSRKEASSPIRKRLEVPMQIQRAWNTCAPTSVSMILAYRGVQELARAMGTDETFGTHNVNAIRVLNQYLFGYAEVPAGQAGYHLATVTSSASNSEDMRLFKERLRKNIDDGYPLYYTIDNASIYPGHKGEHNVVGTGYELSADGSDVLAVYYIDPSYTVQDPNYGGLKKITPEELLAAMRACQEPNYAW